MWRPALAGVAAVWLGGCGATAALAATARPAAADLEAVRLEAELARCPDHGGVMYALAVLHARAGREDEALRWLDRLLDQGLDLDLDGDPGLARLRGSAGLALRRARAERQRVAADGAEGVLRVGGKDLILEGLAYDPHDDVFYMGSIRQRKIVRVGAGAKAREFIPGGRDGLGEVLGLRVEPGRRRLWACSNPRRGGAAAAGACELFVFELPSGRTLRRFALDDPSGPHLLNDVVVASSGEVFVTDTAGGRVHRLRPDGSRLEPLTAAGALVSPNGLALAPDQKRLFVADACKGIALVELATGAVQPLPRPAGISVFGIDGLYFQDGALLGVQNASGGAERLVQLPLDAGLARITGLRILESRNPWFRVPSTGAFARGAFYLIANSQQHARDQAGALKPGAALEEIRLLRIPIPAAAGAAAE